MSDVFYNCESLKELPDISKWNTENVENVNSMFENCISLTSLPNISKWIITNILYMNYTFKNCKSIPNLKESLNWNTSEQIETFGMFEGINLSEGENQILENENNRGPTCLQTIINIICNFFRSRKINYYFIIICLIYSSLYFFIYNPIILLYNSFNFNDLKEYIHKPTKYFTPTNNINIEYISEFHNINNLTKIEENKEKYINNILNFTNIY